MKLSKKEVRYLKDMDLIEATRKARQEVAHPQFVTREIIEQIVGAIVQARNPEMIVMFGSYARGSFGWDSDLDLFVVMETDLPPVERTLGIRRLFKHSPCPMDIIVYTPAELGYWKDVPSSFVHHILTQGMILYERASEDAGATVGFPSGE